MKSPSRRKSPGCKYGVRKSGPKVRSGPRKGLFRCYRSASEAKRARSRSRSRSPKRMSVCGGLSEGMCGIAARCEWKGKRGCIKKPEHLLDPVHRNPNLKGKSSVIALHINGNYNFDWSSQYPNIHAVFLEHPAADSYQWYFDSLDDAKLVGRWLADNNKHIRFRVITPDGVTYLMYPN